MRGTSELNSTENMSVKDLLHVKNLSSKATVSASKGKLKVVSL